MYSLIISLLQQEPPAETSAYMIAGYAVIFGVMLVYLASLAIRSRNLKQDLEVLQDLENREDPGLEREGQIPVQPR